MAEVMDAPPAVDDDLGFRPAQVAQSPQDDDLGFRPAVQDPNKALLKYAAPSRSEAAPAVGPNPLLFAPRQPANRLDRAANPMAEAPVQQVPSQIGVAPADLGPAPPTDLPSVSYQAQQAAGAPTGLHLVKPPAPATVGEEAAQVGAPSTLVPTAPVAPTAPPSAQELARLPGGAVSQMESELPSYTQSLVENKPLGDEATAQVGAVKELGKEAVGTAEQIGGGLKDIFTPTKAEQRASGIVGERGLAIPGAPMTTEETAAARAQMMRGLTNTIAGGGQVALTIGAPEISEMASMAATGDVHAIVAMTKLAGGFGAGAVASHEAGNVADKFNLTPEAKDLLKTIAFVAPAALGSVSAMEGDYGAKGIEAKVGPVSADVGFRPAYRAPGPEGSYDEGASTVVPGKVQAGVTIGGRRFGTQPDIPSSPAEVPARTPSMITAPAAATPPSEPTNTPGVDQHLDHALPEALNGTGHVSPPEGTVSEAPKPLKPIVEAATNQPQPVGQKDPETGRDILQPSDNPVTNQKLATAAMPELRKGIETAVASIPGVELAASRPSKNPERLAQKTEGEGQPAETINDYGAAQISVASPEAKDATVAALRQQFPVVREEDDFDKGDDTYGYRKVSMQVQMPNGVTQEIQIVPKEVFEANPDEHHLYKAARNAKIEGDTPEFDEAAAAAKKKNDAAMAMFEARNRADAAAHRRSQSLQREGGRGESPEQAAAGVQTAPVAATTIGSQQEPVVEESRATIDKQLEGLVAGNYSTVMLPEGSAYKPEVPKGMESITVAGKVPGAGTFIFNPKQITPDKIVEAASAGTHGALLGHTQSKADVAGTHGAVVQAVAKDGTPVQDSVVPANPQAVQQQAEVMAQRHPEADVRVRPADTVVNERLAASEGFKSGDRIQLADGRQGTVKHFSPQFKKARLVMDDGERIPAARASELKPIQETTHGLSSEPRSEQQQPSAAKADVLPAQANDNAGGGGGAEAAPVGSRAVEAEPEGHARHEEEVAHATPTKELHRLRKPEAVAPRAGETREAAEVDRIAEAAGGRGSNVKSSVVEPKRSPARELAKRLSERGKNASIASEALQSRTSPWYLKSEKIIDQKMKFPMRGRDVLRMLENAGVKADEIKWTGLGDTLNHDDKVTPAQVKAAIAEGGIQVKEVTKGSQFPRPTQKQENALLDWVKEHHPQEQDAVINVLTKIDDGQRSMVGELAGVGLPEELLEPYKKFTSGDSLVKFGTYQLPGGENYREKLLTMPAKDMRAVKAATALSEEGREWDEDEHNEARIAVRQSTDFKSSHWDEPNVLAHVRFNDRTTPDGKKLLHLEELQSDWHQKGRSKGYKEPELSDARPSFTVEGDEHQWHAIGEDGKTISSVGKRTVSSKEDAETYLQRYIGSRIDEKAQEQRRDNYGKAPEAPFKKDWHEMAFRRMVHYAAENGYDGVSWTPGEKQAERYDLSKQVDSIAVPVVHDGERSVRIDPTGGTSFKMMVKNDGTVEGYHSASQFTGKKLDEVIGKDMAKKVMEATEPTTFSGEGLKVGGEGMKGFYDKIIPDYARKFGKQWGTKVSDATIPAGESTHYTYDGPTRTDVDVQKLLKMSDGSGNDNISPFTGEKMMFPVQRVALRDQLKDVRASMMRGMSFEDAVAKNGSEEVAEWFGGKLNATNESDTENVPYLEVNDAMRKSVTEEGVPLFKRSDSAKFAEAADRSAEENVSLSHPELVDSDGRSHVVLNHDGWYAMTRTLNLPKGWSAITIPAKLASEISTELKELSDYNREQNKNEVADGYKRLADAIEQSGDSGSRSAIVFRPDHGSSDVLEEHFHAWQLEYDLQDSVVSAMNKNPIVQAMRPELLKHGYNLTSPHELMAEVTAKAASGDGFINSKDSNKILSDYIDALHKEGVDTDKMPTVHASVQKTVESLKEKANETGQEKREDHTLSRRVEPDTRQDSREGRSPSGISEERRGSSVQQQESNRSRDDSSSQGIESRREASVQLRDKEAVDGVSEDQVHDEGRGGSVSEARARAGDKETGGEPSTSGERLAERKDAGREEESNGHRPRQDSLFKRNGKPEGEEEKPVERSQVEKLKDMAEPLRDELKRHENIADVAGTVHDILQNLDRTNKASTLEAKGVVRAFEDSGFTKEDGDKVFAHIEDPSVKLTPKQEELRDKWIKPLDARSASQRRTALLIKSGKFSLDDILSGKVPQSDVERYAPEQDNYQHRIPADKNSMANRIMGDTMKRFRAGGSSLARTFPSGKKSVFYEIHGPDGERHAVAVKGGRVTLITPKGSEDIGSFRGGMTNAGKETDERMMPFVKRITELRDEIAGAKEADKQEQLASVKKRIAELRKQAKAMEGVKIPTGKTQVFGGKTTYTREPTFSQRAAITRKLDDLLKREERLNDGTEPMLAKNITKLDARKEELKGTEDFRDAAISEGEKLEGQTWKDKNGKQWKFDRGTTKFISEQTGQKYHANAPLASIINYMETAKAMNAAVVMEQTKGLLESNGMAVKPEDNPALIPDGWKPTSLLQMRGYYFPEYIADSLDQYHSLQSRGEPNVVQKAGRFLVQAVLMNPLMHGKNIAANFFTGKAAEAITGNAIRPSWYTHNMEAGVKAVNALRDLGGKEYRKLLRLGLDLQGANTGFDQTTKATLQSFTEQLANDKESNAAMSALMAVPNAAKWLQDKNHLATFGLNDLFLLQSYYAKLADLQSKGIPNAETAARDWAHMNVAEYTTPIRVAGSKAAARALENPDISSFWRYHFGGKLRPIINAVNEAAGSYKPDEEASEAAGGQERNKYGQSRAEARTNAIGRLAVLTLMATIILPRILDKLAKKITGDEQAKFPRGGTIQDVSNIYESLKGERSWADTAAADFTPSLSTEEFAELLVNRDFFTGKHIRGTNVDAEAQAKQLGQWIANKSMPGELTHKFAQGKGKQAMYALLGFTFPMEHGLKEAAEVRGESSGSNPSDPQKSKAFQSILAAAEQAHRSNGQDTRLKDALLRSGALTPGQRKELIAAVRESPIVFAVDGIEDGADVWRVYQHSTDDEKSQILGSPKAFHKIFSYEHKLRTSGDLKTADTVKKELNSRQH